MDKISSGLILVCSIRKLLDCQKAPAKVIGVDVFYLESREPKAAIRSTFYIVKATRV